MCHTITAIEVIAAGADPQLLWQQSRYILTDCRQHCELVLSASSDHCRCTSCWGHPHHHTTYGIPAGEERAQGVHLPSSKCHRSRQQLTCLMCPVRIRHGDNVEPARNMSGQLASVTVSLQERERRKMQPRKGGAGSRSLVGSALASISEAAESDRVGGRKQAS